MTTSKIYKVKKITTSEDSGGRTWFVLEGEEGYYIGTLSISEILPFRPTKVVIE